MWNRNRWIVCNSTSHHVDFYFERETEMLQVALIKTDGHLMTYDYLLFLLFLSRDCLYVTCCISASWKFHFEIAHNFVNKIRNKNGMICVSVKQNVHAPRTNEKKMNRIVCATFLLFASRPLCEITYHRWNAFAKRKLNIPVRRTHSNESLERVFRKISGGNDFGKHQNRSKAY